MSSNFNDFFGCFNNNCGRCNNDGCNDIPGGFQDLNPELFTIVGEILGQIAAGNMPFNVQNAVGNWLELVGQVILTNNAQQQYLECGPGKYYNIKNKNNQNPYCPTDSDESDNDKSEEIKELKDCICVLSNEVKKLKKELNELKKDN